MRENRAGTVLSTQKYWPYGAVRSGSLSQTDKLYTGQQEEPGDSALGLYNYKARFYSTVTGTFASADTSTKDGYNRFAYVRGNPATHNDPTGHGAPGIVPTAPGHPCTPDDSNDAYCHGWGASDPSCGGGSATPVPPDPATPTPTPEVPGPVPTQTPPGPPDSGGRGSGCFPKIVCRAVSSATKHVESGLGSAVGYVAGCNWKQIGGGIVLTLGGGGLVAIGLGGGAAILTVEGAAAPESGGATLLLTIHSVSLAGAVASVGVVAIGQGGALVYDAC